MCGYDAMCGYDVSKCIFKSEIDGLDFIPSSLDLCALDKELVGVQRKEYVLKDVLDKVKSDYDFVFIDCAPSINMLLVNALCAADGVIIPLQCEYLALEGMNQLLNTVRLAKRHLNDSLTVYGVVLTMYTGRSKLSRDVESEIKNCSERKFSRRKFHATYGLRKPLATENPLLYTTTNAQVRLHTTHLQTSLYQNLSRSEVWQTQKAALVQKA